MAHKLRSAMQLSIVYLMNPLKKVYLVMQRQCQTVKLIVKKLNQSLKNKGLCQQVVSNLQWVLQEMLPHIIVSFPVLLKTAWKVSCKWLLRLLKLCVGAVGLAMISVVFVPTVIVLCLLIVLLLALFLLCEYLMLFAEQLYLLVIEEEP